MRLKRIPFRVGHYAKKVAYFRRTSSPFLSQDTFSRVADLDLNKDFYPGVQRVKKASVIFVYSGDTEKFFGEYGAMINAKVLIFGNNDVDFNNFDFTIPKSVKRIYLQNSMIADSFFQILPIGIESLKYVTNGVPGLFANKYIENPKNQRVLVGPFGNTHFERKILLNQKEKSFENVDFIFERLTPKNYAKISSSYSYIACPRGNGLDTHRFWESLYRGLIPVVVESPWSNYWVKRSIPIIEIPSWDYNLDKIENRNLGHVKFNPLNLDVLWEPYWRLKIRQDL